jgi:pimeloyl-ACP methyl ester carboxylesterase
MKRLLKTGVPLAGGLTALAGLGYLYQTAADYRDQRRYPAPGQLVNVNGRCLHLVSQGEGAPTVVFEAGLGSTHLDWCRVFPEVAQFTRAVAYDRAGCGWSAPGPLPRTGRRMATELHDLLAQAGICSPFVLVGHSYGGLIIRLFADQYPNEVTGLVLVDASHEDQKAHIPVQPPLHQRIKEETEWQWYRLRPLLARVGLLRLWSNRMEGRSHHTPEVQPIVWSLGLRARSYDWLWTEHPAIGTTCTQVRESKLADHLLTSILAGGNDFPDPLWQNSWLSLQADLFHRLPNATYRIAENSGHYIQLDQPQMVVDAIHEIVTDIRLKKSG